MLARIDRGKPARENLSIRTNRTQRLPEEAIRRSARYRQNVRTSCKGKSGRIQVDAEMRSHCHRRPPQPEGCVATSPALAARRTSPRTSISADTFRRFAARLKPDGAFPNSSGNLGLIPPVAGLHVYLRALPAPPPGSGLLRRAWRIHNGNAHANRCAPPGRNEGGGTQGQPY